MTIILSIVWYAKPRRGRRRKGSLRSTLIELGFEGRENRFTVAQFATVGLRQTVGDRLAKSLALFEQTQGVVEELIGRGIRRVEGRVWTLDLGHRSEGAWRPASVLLRAVCATRTWTPPTFSDLRAAVSTQPSAVSNQLSAPESDFGQWSCRRAARHGPGARFDHKLRDHLQHLQCPHPDPETWKSRVLGS